MPPLLEIKQLEQRFDVSPGFWDRLHIDKGRVRYDKHIVHAVNGINLHINRGEVFGLVGESGCGKSTVAKTIVKIHEPSGGRILIDGEDITAYDARKMLPIRKKMQMIFQDPYASLNPRMRIRDIITEPMTANEIKPTKNELDARAMGLLNQVGLGDEHVDRYPHQFSGGQRQRIGIARALSIEPELVIADEPVSALDVSIQAQILNLLMDLKDAYGFSCLFIGHDLSVVRHISDRIGVMYLGFLVETGTSNELFNHPKHPYTRALLASAPTLGEVPHTEPIELKSEVPPALDLPTGCCFQSRCPFVYDACYSRRPELQDTGEGHQVACHLIDQ